LGDEALRPEFVVGNQKWLDYQTERSDADKRGNEAELELKMLGIWADKRGTS
jgi:hypothetical protein